MGWVGVGAWDGQPIMTGIEGPSEKNKKINFTLLESYISVYCVSI